MKLQKSDYDKLIDMALAEDLGDAGDVTTDSIFTEPKQEHYRLVAKEDGILCGADIFTEVFAKLDKDCQVKFNFRDGDKLHNGDTVATVDGDVRTILKGERTALNFISHLSGVATKTSRFAAQSNGKLKILDTRKTIPGLRYLQKYAVACGGGQNHRIGLFDMVLIKDNHIDAAGSIRAAVENVRKMWGSKYKIEVETRNLDEVKQALDMKADRIMLDNMPDDIMAEAVKLIDGRAEIEASGNMTIDRIAPLSKIGIDFISFGELTHTVKVFDFSLKK